MLDHAPKSLAKKWKEQKVEGYEIPAGAEVIRTENALMERIVRFIWWHAIKGTRQSFAIAFEGAPGSGKSYIAQKVFEALRDSFAVILHEMDGYLGTERGSKQRSEIFKSIYDFWQGYCRDRKAATDLNRLTFSPPGEILKIPEWYSREHEGKFVERDISIPEGDSRIILFPGSGSGQIIKATEAEHKLTIFVFTDLMAAARQKAHRVLERGEEGIDPSDYLRELKMVTEKRCLPSMDDTAVYFDNRQNLR